MLRAPSIPLLSAVEASAFSIRGMGGKAPNSIPTVNSQPENALAARHACSASQEWNRRQSTFVSSHWLQFLVGGIDHGRLLSKLWKRVASGCAFLFQVRCGRSRCGIHSRQATLPSDYRPQDCRRMHWLGAGLWLGCGPRSHPRGRWTLLLRRTGLRGLPGWLDRHTRGAGAAALSYPRKV